MQVGRGERAGAVGGPCEEGVGRVHGLDPAVGHRLEKRPQKQLLRGACAPRPRLKQEQKATCVERGL